MTPQELIEYVNDFNRESLPIEQNDVIDLGIEWLDI